MNTKIEKPNKRRNINRWRNSRLRRLACISWTERSERQQARITQLEKLINWEALQ